MPWRAFTNQGAQKVQQTLSYGTTLPTAPVDGQEAILVDSITAPTYQWRFRYNAGSSSAYKWEFIGGSRAHVSGISGSTTVSTPTAIGSGFTVPRAGDYTFDYGALLTRATPNEWLYVYLDCSDGTVSVPQLVWLRSAGGSLETQVMFSGVGRALGCAASGLWKLRINNSNGTSSVSASGGYVGVTPIRVS